MHLSPAAALAEPAAPHREPTAVVLGDERVTCRDLWGRARRAAAGLVGRFAGQA